ncbi:hypothetical protein OHT52_31350 [Streptomyces sp. NBC_00247]|uniref:hypothetical protein n=1 Tax=Streptomyces sp. NBC_00247 TaxID=2975689 RepID=UPI002E2ACCA2|nr:hypothetical protein [Streptomyces sp. NBC_00247]
MLDCPNPPPVTVVLDPYDDVVHTRAALASHAPQHGRLTVHPTPGTDAGIALAYDILAALDKPVPLAGHHYLDPAPVWSVVAAWILATPITHLTLLRAHLLTPHRFKDLLTLRRRTEVRLVLVCHHRALRAFLERELRQLDHRVAEASALLPEAEPATVERQASQAARPLANRWISLPALTTLRAFEETVSPCRCAAPMAQDRDFFPPVMPPVTEAEVAWRLHRATAHPYLAAQLATAVFTAASTTQLATAHVRDLAPDGTTVTLHGRGPRRGCMTHTVPAWASPLLRAAALHWSLGTGTSGPLFSDPLGDEGTPSLTAFAEDCKLRPPQPPRPKPRGSRRGTTPGPKQPVKTIWPVCTAHYEHSLAEAEPDLMQGCPYPPPHTRKTIERRKKGWLPPDYGLRELRHLR